MYKPINGFTKKTILETIEREFKEKSHIEESFEGDTRDCLYRGPNGNKCAVGCFIPDSKYKPSMDSISDSTDVEALLYRFEELRVDMPLPLSALKVFQCVHDNAHPIDSDVKGKLLDWVRLNVEDT